MKKNKLRVVKAFIVQTDLGKKNTQDAIHYLLALRNRPTAVIAFNDYVALDAIQYIRYQGLKMNKDIFFASYDNLPLTSYLDDLPYASVE